MKKKVLIKWIIGCVMLCIMLLVLWKRTHINYDEYSEKTSDMQHDEVEEIRFPDYINEKVSDGLVFDAFFNVVNWCKFYLVIPYIK